MYTLRGRNVRCLYGRCLSPISRRNILVISLSILQQDKWPSCCWKLLSNDFLCGHMAWLQHRKLLDTRKQQYKCLISKNKSKHQKKRKKQQPTQEGFPGEQPKEQSVWLMPNTIQYLLDYLLYWLETLKVWKTPMGNLEASKAQLE